MGLFDRIEDLPVNYSGFTRVIMLMIFYSHYPNILINILIIYLNKGDN